MVTAVILAGGHGERMRSKLPKQFIEVRKTPIIVHTLRNIAAHPLIDALQVVCIPEWKEQLQDCINKFAVPKIRGITAGGDSRYLSTRKGIEALGDVADDDVIIVHDGVRPLVNQNSLTDVINVCRKHGNSMAAIPCYDTMYNLSAEDCTAQVADRDKLRRGQTPEAVTGKRMKEMYRLADERGITSDSVSALQIALGWKIYFAQGDPLNMKITRTEDLLTFRALNLLIEGDLLKLEST